MIQDVIQTVGETLDEISNEFSHAVSEVTRDILHDIRSAIVSVGEARRRLNLMTAVGSGKPVPLSHFYTHIPKLAHCPFCEMGKM